MQFHSIVQQVTAAPQALMQRGHELYRLLRLNAAVCLSLKSFAATQFYEIFPHLSELYSAATAFVKQADTPAAARRVLRLVRKQILVVTTVRGLSLAVRERISDDGRSRSATASDSPWTAPRSTA